MMMLLTFMFLTMFVYVNTLYYSMALLGIVLLLLYMLVSNLMMHTLTMILLAVVYIGAMMILIGYICAICPNLILSPNYYSPIWMVALLSFVYFLVPFHGVPFVDKAFVPMVEYFYTYSGLVVFVTLILMLFLTLLMVTSQYMTPKGPFRSVTI